MSWPTYKLSIIAFPFPLLIISSIYVELLVPWFHSLAVSVHASDHLKSSVIGASKGFCVTGFTFYLSVLCKSAQSVHFQSFVLQPVKWLKCLLAFARLYSTSSLEVLFWWMC